MITISEYVFAISRASTAPPNDHGVVAVIDGQTVKVTPFRTANAPPPMALHELEIQSNSIDVAFNLDASSIVVLHQEGLSIYEWKSVAASAVAPELSGRVTLAKTDSSEATYRQVSFTENGQVIILQTVGSKNLLKRYGFSEETGRMAEITSSDGPNTDIQVLSSFCRDGTVHAFEQGSSGDLLSLTLENQSLSYCSFLTFLPWVEIVPYGEDLIAFGMSSNGHLYANSRLLVKNCTSFLATSAHLIFTTTTHLLKFVHITNVTGMCPLCGLPLLC